MSSKGFSELSIEIDAAVHTARADGKTTAEGLNGLLKSLARELVGSAPAVPVATATVLGGIKVGQNLTVLADGTVSATAGIQDQLAPASAVRAPSVNAVNDGLARVQFNTAPPYVAVRPDGTTRTDFAQLRPATDWAGTGTVFTNRPGVGTNQNILASGTLDLQGMPLDMAGGDLHLYPGARIINNKLLYNGRIFLRGQGSNVIQGGVLAMQTYQQPGTAQELLLDGVTVADFGYRGTFYGTPQGDAATVGPFTVRLRNGGRFFNYAPDPATTVIDEGTALLLQSPEGIRYYVRIDQSGNISIQR